MIEYWAELVYLLFALGAVGVFFLLPGREGQTRAAGWVLSLAALIGVLSLCGFELLASNSSTVTFCASAAVALAAAVKVITHEKPVYSALYFVLTVLAVTPLLILQSAEFLAVALVIVYAGAIIVTYVFVIMLAQQSDQPRYDRQAREPLVAVVAGFVTTGLVASQIRHLPTSRVTPAAHDVDLRRPMLFDNTEEIGGLVISQYVVAFEIAGVLLLIAMIGAIAVSRKRVPAEDWAGPASEPGKIGREVPPF